MKKLFNDANDKFFMSLVLKGDLKVFKDGRILNNKTGRFIGAMSSGGYMKISIPSHPNPDYKKGKSKYKWVIKHMQVHRLVYLVYKGKIPSGYYVDHRNFNKAHNGIGNLQLLTPSENSIKSVLDGTSKPLKGANNGNAALNNVAAKAIRWMHLASMYSSRELARLYNVNTWVVYDIIKGKSYSQA